MNRDNAGIKKKLTVPRRHFHFRTVLLSIYLVPVIMGGFVGSLSAQNVQYFGWFPTIDHSGQLSANWSYNVYLFDAIKPYTSTEIGQRDKARSFFAYGECGITRQITDRLALTCAAVYERQNPFLQNYRNERRLFQQLTYKYPVKRSELKHRLRFDERFIQNRATGQWPFTHRLRYLLGVKFPLVHDKLYVVTYSEVFLNTSNKFKFDENWSACQLGYNISKSSSLETGLLYVGWIYNSFNNWLHQYYMQTTWVYRLDLKKLKNQDF